LAPSVVTVASAVQVSIPDNASVQPNDTVTSLLFHPLALAAGRRLGVIDGGVLSRLMAGDDAVVTLPAMSVAVTVRVSPDPSVVKCRASAVGTPAGIPDPVSLIE
jgi:hypothetical protein